MFIQRMSVPLQASSSWRGTCHPDGAHRRGRCSRGRVVPRWRQQHPGGGLRGCHSPGALGSNNEHVLW